MNKTFPILLNLVIIVFNFLFNLQAQTIEQRLLIVENDQTIGGNFRILIQVKGTSLPLANTLGSATIDVQFNNTHLSFVNATNWTFGFTQGYSRSANNNTTSIRISVIGLGVNANGGGDPPGFDIRETYESWVQLNFKIQTITTTNLTINHVTNAIGLFENHSNEPFNGVINNQILTAPENIIETPLPVELTSFTASINQNKVELHWQTKTELNNNGFDIERKINEGEWINIGFVKGNGTTTELNEYSYSDKDIYSRGNKFQYRLKQIDNDGSFEYSDIVEVKLIPSQFELFQNYPNPFNPSTTISFSLPQETQLKITICNMLGELIDTLVDGTYHEGYHKINFDASNLSSGAYIYRIESNKFIQIKKMMLLR